jgi:DNA ligase (NAD+)
MNKPDQLATQLQQLSVAYHNFGTSPVDDSTYDTLKRQLRERAPDHSFLKQVGAPAPKSSHLKKARHKIHMGSVANAMNEEEFNKWWNKYGKPTLFATLKVDGLSINLEYEKGQFKRAITRGDGIEGEDVTANVIRARDLPLYLSEHKDFTGSVRAEVLLYKEDWKKVDPDAKTARNAAAGTVRRKNGKGAEWLRVIAHDLYPTKMVAPGTVRNSHPLDASNDSEHVTTEFKTVYRKFLHLMHMGFKVPLATTAFPVEDPAHTFNYVAENREGLPYEIDGVVFSIDDAEKFYDLGIDGEACYRGQIARKFPAQSAVTQLLGVTLTVGHTGAVNPVAVLAPVLIGGVTVTSASLANFDEIDRLGLHIGDSVSLDRAGDVIPKLTGVVVRGEGGQVLRPKVCPACAGELSTRTNVSGEIGVIIYCLNQECPAKPIGKLKRWVKSLNILGAGDEVLEALLEARIVETVDDLYYLDQHADWKLADLKLNGRRFGEKRAQSLLAEINKTKELTLDRFLGSLGIQHLGKRRVELIRKAEPDGRLNNIHDWFSVEGSGGDDFSYLIAFAGDLGIPGIAAEIQADINANRELITRLLRCIKIKPEEPVVQPLTDSPLSAKSFCFTGCRPNPEEKAVLAQLGAEEKSGVSKGLTYLVTKTEDTTSSKAVKAKSLDVKLITYDRFKSLLAGK